MNFTEISMKLLKSQWNSVNFIEISVKFNEFHWDFSGMKWISMRIFEIGNQLERRGAWRVCGLASVHGPPSHPETQGRDRRDLGGASVRHHWGHQAQVDFWWTVGLGASWRVGGTPRKVPGIFRRPKIKIFEKLKNHPNVRNISRDELLTPSELGERCKWV